MIDLHMHSRYSDDGEYTPAELAARCAAEGIAVMSVTDHNCIQANLEAQEAAQENGIGYIPGIEIDCTFHGVNFHVLGYGIDYESEDFRRIEQNIRQQSFQASKDMLEKTQALGFPVTKEDMQDIAKDHYWKDAWTGEMFAEVLLNKPELQEHPMLKPYRPGGLRSDNPYVNFYWDYYSQGKPCYVKIDYPPMEDIIDVIHRNQGIAVLAHPGVNLKAKEELLEEILELAIDGIEAFSSYHTPEQAEYYYRKAAEKQLLVTCGSDFHGKTKPAIQLGKAVFSRTVNLDREIDNMMINLSEMILR